MINQIVPLQSENCNAMQIFSYEQNSVRTVTLNGEPWFIAADVCEALDIQNSTQAVGRLDDDEKAMLNIGLTGGDTNIINEPGLYSLILGSRKPEAKAFKRWITHDVIPAIRKTGTYTAPPMSSLEIMRSMLDAQIQSEKRMSQVETSVARLETKINTALEKPVIVDWCKFINAKINMVVEARQLNHQVYRGDVYKELDQTARCNLEARQTQLRKRMREAGHTYKECRAVSKLQVIDADPKLRAIFETIVCRESARYS